MPAGWMKTERLVTPHGSRPAPDLRALRADVPVDVAALVTAMLEKAPERRPGLAAVLDGLRPHG